PAPNEDPAAFALRAAAALPHAGDDIASITRAYLAARYEDDRDGRALAELKRRVSAFAPRVPRAPRAPRAPKTPRTSRTPYLPLAIPARRLAACAAAVTPPR